MFAGSDMPINLLSANHGNAWNVLIPGILVVGGVQPKGMEHWDGALVLRPGNHCSFSYVWASQENGTVGLWGIFHLFGVGYGQIVACVKLG